MLKSVQLKKIALLLITMDKKELIIFTERIELAELTFPTFVSVLIKV